MLFFYEVLTTIILSIILIIFIIDIFKGRINTVIFVYVCFYVFFVIPNILNFILGIPEYGDKIGFTVSSNDDITKFIYNTYLLFISVIWLLFNYRKKVFLSKINNEFGILNSPIIKYILWAFLGLPLILVLFSPDPSLYLKYGVVLEKFSLNKEFFDYHTYIHTTSLISIISGILLLFLKKNKALYTFVIFVFPLIFISIWLNGKRSAVVLFVILLIISFVIKGVLKGKKLIVVSILFLVSLYFYNDYYQTNLKYENFQNTIINEEVNYKNFRINYGRDDVTKLAIYSLLNKEEVEILEYRGQSFLFYTFFYIPREFWENKPWPYPIYVTSALYLNNIPAEYIGWTMTTSLLEETISNFGFLGFIIGPLIISLFCRIGDKSENYIFKIYTILICCLFIVLPLSSFLPLFVGWIFLSITLRRKLASD